MKKLFAALAVSVVGAVVLLWGSPAFAHDVRWTGPYDCGPTLTFACGYVQVRASHTTVDACDTQADGYGYKAEYHVSFDSFVRDVVDGNGSASGCGIQTAPSNVVTIRGCTHQLDSWFCGPWVAA